MANVKNVNDILIGTGKVFLDGYDVGQMDGDVNFTHGKEYFEKKSGFPAQVVKKVLIGEKLTQEFNLLEANLATIRRLMPEYASVTGTAGTATVTDEVVSLYSNKHSLLSQGRIKTLTSVKLASDNTVLVEGTDFYLDRLTGALSRNESSVDLDEGEAVKVTYEHHTFDTEGIGIGGGTTTDQTFQMEFWHKRTDGRYRCVRIWKCQVDGDFTMGFKEQADAPIPVKITAMTDSSKPSGQQLGVVIDVPASAAPDGGW